MVLAVGCTCSSAEAGPACRTLLMKLQGKAAVMKTVKAVGHNTMMHSIERGRDKEIWIELAWACVK